MSNRSAKNISVQAVIIPEFKFSDIQRQIFVTDLMEIAHDAALDERPEAFDCVRMNRADNVLSLAVVNGLMRETALQSIIAVIGIGAKQTNAGRDGFANESLKGFALCIRDDAGDDVSLAPDCADDSGLERVAGTAGFPAFLIPMPVFVVPADESFVNLNDPAKFFNIFNEGDADFVAHQPSSLIGAEAHITVDLKRGHSLLADQHQVNDAIPVFQRLVCVLEDCAGQVREAVASVWRALVALPMPRIALQFWRHDRAATRATDAFGPSASYQIANAIVLRLKKRVELRCGQLMDGLRFRLLLAGHDGSPRLIGASLHA
jgi:hypothetical protein